MILMPPNVHTFLFSPPEDISPYTSRRVHLRRLYDILHLSIQRGDLQRARRAWAILARCKEIDWRTSWILGLGLLGSPTGSDQTKIDYLRTMMLHSLENRESILCELVHLYILAGRHREALDELEFFLPSFPYHDNAVLHIYAGMCSAFASQSTLENEADVGSVDSDMLDRAQIFFERAKSLDAENIVVDTLLAMTQNLAQNPRALSQAEGSDEETDPRDTEDSARHKRLRA